LFESLKEDPQQFLTLFLTILVIFVARFFIRRLFGPDSTRGKKARGVATLTELNIYPIKSCKGFSVPRWKVGKFGLEFDRMWMIISPENNRFITQRQQPKLATLSPEFNEKKTELLLTAPGMNPIQIPISKEKKKQSPEIIVGIWGDNCRAVDEGDEVSKWLTSFLGVEARLVRMPDNHDREISPKYSRDGLDNVVSFADAFPFLLISEESLEFLNTKLEPEHQLTMNRFRPNFVVKGTDDPFSEDKWKKIRIGNSIFHLVKPCSRCKTTTVDQSKGVFDGNEPLSTLKTFREWDLDGNKSVFFGQNLIHENFGDEICVNERIELLR